MAKLPSRSPLTVPVENDLMHVVDVSDTTDDPLGTSKKMELSYIKAITNANKVVIVNKLADFPAPVGGVITLVANTTYFIGDDVSLGTNRIVCSTGGLITSGNPAGGTLTYTGTNNMFTGIDVGRFTFFNAHLDSPNAISTFNFSDTTPGTSFVFGFFIQVENTPKYAVLDSLAATVWDQVNSINADFGFETKGTGWLTVSYGRFAFQTTSATFIGVDLTTSVIANLGISDPLIVALTPGAIGIKGLANSGNVSTGNIATLRDANFIGSITPLSGISVDDIRWSFMANGGIPDTMPDAMISLNSNATETSIGEAGTAVKIAGTWVVERESHFTADTTGRITYNGERDLTIPIDAVTTAKSASGTNKDITFYIALNGSIITNSSESNRVSSNDKKNTSNVWQLTLSTNDYLELFVANDTDTVNIIVESATYRVR
jgi:hypothetical protein